MRAFAIISLLFAATAAAQVPVEGASSLQQCIEQGELVTIVLQNGVEDPNQVITGLGSSYLSVENQKGDHAAYLFNDVERVVVQEGEVARRTFRPGMSPILTSEERRIIEQALQVCRARLDSGSGPQSVRIFCAGALAAREKEEGAEYLRRLIESNDLETALLAAVELYVATGERLDTGLVERGLDSGNRNARSLAARLAAAMDLLSAEPYLLDMLDDIDAQAVASALVGLALLDAQDAVPAMVKELRSRNETKHEAAVGALSIINGEEAKQRLWKMAEEGDLSLRFRILKALYGMGDEEAAKQIRQQFLDVVTLQWEAAVLLASHNDPAGKQFLRDWLSGPYDTDARTLKRRALAALALAESGDTSHTGAIAELLGSEHNRAAVEFMLEMAQTDVRSLLPLLAPRINAGAPIAAYVAVLQVTPEMRERATSAMIEQHQ